MSKVTPLIENPPDLTEAVSQVRRITSDSIGEIRRRITAGEPVYECVLYKNDHDEVAAALRRFVAVFPASGAALRAFLFTSNAAPTPMPLSSASRNEIPLETLQNILSRHDEGILAPGEQDDRVNGESEG